MKKIPLDRGQFAIVDDADYARVVAVGSWHVHSQGYAAHSSMLRVGGKRKDTQILMHRLIMAAPSDLSVDHINHNRLDNRRANLRLCSKMENLWNSRKTARQTTSAFKGVSWHGSTKKWVAYISKNKRRFHLGRFHSEREAADAYNFAARSLFGDFAKTN